MVSKLNRLGIHKVLFRHALLHASFGRSSSVSSHWLLSYINLDTSVLLSCCSSYTQMKDDLPLSLSFPTTLHLISFSLYGSCPGISATHIDNSLSIIPLTEVGKCRDLLYAYNDRQLPKWHNLSEFHLLQKQTYCTRCLIVTIHHCSLNLWQSPRPLSL